MKKSGVVYTKKPSFYRRILSLISVIVAFILVFVISQEFLVPKTSTASAWYYQQPYVSIQNMMFNPYQITVPAGTVITWHNYDMMPHTVTSDSNLWDSGVLQPGQGIAIRISTPGIYAYHCRIHPFMHGIIVITNAMPTSYGYMLPNSVTPNYYATSNPNMYNNNPAFYSNDSIKNSYPIPSSVNAGYMNYYVLNSYPRNVYPNNLNNFSNGYSSTW